MNDQTTPMAEPANCVCNSWKAILQSKVRNANKRCILRPRNRMGALAVMTLEENTAKC